MNFCSVLPLDRLAHSERPGYEFTGGIIFIHKQLVLKRVNNVQAVLGRPPVEDEVLSRSDCSTFLHYLFPGRTCQRKASPPPETPKAPRPATVYLAQERGAFKRRKAVM